MSCLDETPILEALSAAGKLVVESEDKADLRSSLGGLSALGGLIHEQLDLLKAYEEGEPA